MKMLYDAFYNHLLVIDFIVINDDSTMRAVLKYPSIGVRGQFLKSSKGKLDEETPDLFFLADPYHWVKIVSKHIFSIVNKSRAQGCGCTKSDALQFKKYWGYTIKKNREKIIEELS